MDVKNYMTEDIEFIERLLTELDTNIEVWSSDKVLEKTSDIFHAFDNRFALEDFVLRHVKPVGGMKQSLEIFLTRRRDFRATLENVLMLHVDEPEFAKEIKHVLEAVSKHMVYIKTEFDPNFVDKITPEQMAIISTDLGKKVRLLNFA